MAADEPPADDDEDEDAKEPEQRAVSFARNSTLTGRRDLEMDVIGWAVFLVLIVVIIPLLPFLLLVAAITKLLGFGEPRAVSWNPRHSWE